MSDEFRAWLSHELKQRSWSYRELARRANISNSLISRTLTGDIPPSADFCIKVAQSLSESPEKLLRLARILPSLPSSEDATLQELWELARNLPPEHRKEALRYIRYLYQSGQEDD